MTPPPSQLSGQLVALLNDSPWMMRVLATVRDSALPDAWVGAGTIRDLVWGTLYGNGFDPATVRDIDVAFYDATDLNWDRNDQATGLLNHAWPGQPWEARNQAAIHTWYHHRFGGDPVAPLTSIEDAVTTWPETATAVVARLDNNNTIHLCTPHGLDDLLGGIWRRNPTRVSLAESRARLARHRPQQRWPGVNVITPT